MFFISWRDDELSRRQIDTPVAEDGFVVVVVLVVGIVVVNGPEKTFGSVSLLLEMPKLR